MRTEIDMRLLTILVEFDELGQLVVTTEMNPILPDMINEMDLRHKINRGIATAYLDCFNELNEDPERKEWIRAMAELLKASVCVYVQHNRNPKSTENDHEII